MSVISRGILPLFQIFDCLNFACRSMFITTSLIYDFQIEIEVLPEAIMFIPSRIISMYGVLLLLGGFVTKTVRSCPSGYTCRLAGGVFTLYCKAADDGLRSEMVAGTIRDIPENITRLKVYCYSQRILFPLAFANLPNIRELTLENLNISAMGRHVFHPITHLTHLNLIGVYRKRFDADWLDGLTELRSLIIEHINGLDYMAPNMLKPLLSLQTMSFRYINPTKGELYYADYSRLLAGVSSFSLQSLTLYAVHSKYNHETGLHIDKLFGNSSVGTTLRYLDIGHNNLWYVRGSPLKALPMLEHFLINDNDIIGSRGSLSLSMFWMELLVHPRLKSFSMNGLNRLAAGTSTNVFFGYNANKDCRRYLNVTFGRKLEAVSMRDTVFLSNKFILDFQICYFDPSGSLKYMDVTNIRSTKSILGSLGHIHALEYFFLQNAHLRSIETDIFQGMPNLTVLLIGKNNIGRDIASDTDARLFRNNHKLRVLDLAECGIQDIPQTEFSNLYKLQYLNLSGNALVNINVTFDTLRELRSLNMSHNNLTTLPSAIRSHLDNMAAVRKMRVDISGNPLQCHCNNTDFVTWSRNTRVTFLNQDNTFCVDVNNSLAMLFRMDLEALEIACHPYLVSAVTIKNGRHLDILLPTMIVLAVVSVLACLTYRYRWKCVYCWTHATRSSAVANEALHSEDHERDAFICYNSNDRGWVCNELMQHFEERDISMVIHQRDFLPGSVVEELIRESIAKSRYTVLVLSPDFLSSNWCLLEMHLARSCQCREGRGGILPIILREFPMSLLTPTLEDIMSKSYLKWTDNPQGQLLFWDKLVTKMKQGGNLRPVKMQEIYD